VIEPDVGLGVEPRGADRLEPGQLPGAPTSLTFQEQSVLWGQAYEVLVKRGVLACLVEHGLLEPTREQLRDWTHTRLLDVHTALLRGLAVIDENAVRLVDAALEHMALTAYGLGYTATREYLRPLRREIETERLRLRALWCPLTLPGTSGEDLPHERAARFHRQFGLTGVVDPALAHKGQPANSDFTLWLAGEHKTEHLLVQEYSFDMPAALGDYRDQQAHVEELLRHRRLLDSRSVFASVSAEVTEESFELARDICTHLTALTAGNKPLYKLCQASGYAESTASWLRRDGVQTKPCVARALAVTPNGLESLAARFDRGDAPEPRRVLMERLGTAYREAVRVQDGDEAELDERIGAVFRDAAKAAQVAARRHKGPGAHAAPGRGLPVRVRRARCAVHQSGRSDAHG